MAVCGVKDGNIKDFENIGPSTTITIYHGHIHKICEKVFPRKNYRKNTLEMTLFQKYEVFIKK